MNVVFRRRFWIVFVLCASLIGLEARGLLVHDGFSDGGRSNGSDAHDVVWYTIGAPGGALTVVNDSGGIGSGNAMRLAPTGVGQGIVGHLPTTVNLRDGESLTLTFQFRFTGTTNLNLAGRLRFGLYDSGGTLTTADASGALRTNDQGYYGQTNPGAAGSSGTSNCREVAADEITMGGGITQFGAQGHTVNCGTTPHTARLVLTRRGTSLSASTSIDDERTADGTHTTALTYAFDTVAISLGFGATPSPVIIDNVKIDYRRATLGERFADGGRSNGADVADGAWYTIGASGSAVSTVNDNVSGGIHAGSAVRLAATGSGQGLVVNLPSAVTLIDGDAVTLSFDWRFTGTTGINQANRLRFGLYNSGGTLTSADAQSTPRYNDAGYYGQTNPGAASGSGTSIVRETAIDEIGGFNGASSFGSPGASVSGGTVRHSAELNITRNGNTLSFSVRIDGLSAATGVDANPVTYTFDEAVITLGTAGPPSPLIIDNVKVRSPNAPLQGGTYYLTFQDNFNTMSIQNPLEELVPPNGINASPTNTSRGWWRPIYKWGGWPSTDDTRYHKGIWEHHRLNNMLDWNIWNQFRMPNGAIADAGMFTNAHGILTMKARPMTATERTIMQTDPVINDEAFFSSMITTFPTFYQSYGYFELRVKVPTDGKGHWPAFWTGAQDWTWPPEIDVFEFIGSSSSVAQSGFQNAHQTVHMPSGGPGTTGQAWTFIHGQKAYDGFHTYGLEWLPNKLIWYIDGIETRRVNRSISKPLYIIINTTTMGGPSSWPGAADGTTPWPALMQLDYFRAYSTTQPSSVKGPG